MISQLDYPPLLIQSLIRDNTQYCEYLNKRAWDFNNTKYSKPLILKTKFVEIQSPMVDSEFLYWFLNVINNSFFKLNTTF